MTVTGVLVPLITPFDASGAVALPALESLAHQVLDAGASGIVALGTTAEHSSLTAEEQRSVVDLLSSVCRDRRVPLIAGGATGIVAGVTATLGVVPPFVRPGEAGVVAHFTALAEASPIPIVVYHVPYRTAQPLSANTIRQLAAIPGVIAIKHAAGGIDADTIDLLADPPPPSAGPGGFSIFSILGGDDPFISPVLALGAHGGILASAHVATAHFVELFDAWQAGAVTHARGLGHRLATLSRALFAEPNPTVIKAILHAQGRIPTPDVRLPLLRADHGSLSPVMEALQALCKLRRS